MKPRLPSDWVISPLGDLATAIQYGYTEKARQEKVGPRFLRITDIQDDSVNWNEVPFCVIDEKDKEKYLLGQGDLVFARTGATVGKSFLITGSIPESVFASYLIRVRLRADIEPKYVSYFFRSNDYWRQISESQAGIGQPNVNGKKLAQIQIPVAPLDQQKRIVAEIEKQFSRLDEAVANLKRVKANLNRYKASVLKASVEGRLVETEAELARLEGRSFETGAQLLQRILETRRSQWQGKGKYKEHAAPDTTDLPELPEGWVWAAVAQVADVASGNTPSGILEAVKETGEVPWFKVGDMNHEENQQVMRRADAWLSTSEAKKLGLRQFPPSTVLFPKRGGAIATNKKRRLELPGCADLNVMGITPVQEITSYLFTWFDGVNLVKLSDGSNVPQINHKDIEPLLIPLPPLAEQHRIAAEVDRRLTLLRETEAQVGANLRRAERLRQSVLAQMFNTSVEPA